MFKKEKEKTKRFPIGKIKKKILLLLAAGVALSAAKTIGKQWQIVGDVSKEWKHINRMSLKRSLDSLYTAKLLELKPQGDGYTMVLSRNGQKIISRLNLETIRITKQKNWDGKWRIVMFDVPERLRKVRDALRFHFKQIGLIEYQKSVFIIPYPCEKEIKFIAEFYHSFKSVKFVVADVISDEKDFIKKFDL